MTKKRILLISRCPPWPLYLGDRLIIYHLAHELELAGHEIDLLAFTNRPEDLAEQGEYDMYFRHVELIPEPARSQASYLRRVVLPASRWPKRAEESWSPQMWRAIERRLKAEQYDAIHLFGGIQVYEFFGALAGRQAIITPYESYSLYLRRVLDKASVGAGVKLSLVHAKTYLQRMMARQFEHFMFAPYQKMVVVSEADRDELLGINPTLPVEVIPNGVDTYEFRPRPTRRVPALLFVGNYEYAPNVDAVLRLVHEIFPVVQAQIPEAHLWLVGNAPTPEMVALANDSIRVTGRVPDVRPYLARAAVFVSPLRLGAGIKNKVLEALAMGCPLAATPISIDGIAVRHEHDALVADDNKALIEAAVRLLRDDDLRQKFSLNGRALIERQYSWTSTAQRYEALYDQR